MLTFDGPAKPIPQLLKSSQWLLLSDTNHVILEVEVVAEKLQHANPQFSQRHFVFVQTRPLFVLKKKKKNMEQSSQTESLNSEVSQSYNVRRRKKINTPVALSPCGTKCSIHQPSQLAFLCRTAENLKKQNCLP